MPGTILSTFHGLELTPLVSQTVKRLAYNAGDQGSIPGSGRSSWRRKWQPTPVFLPGKSHGLRSLVDYSPPGRKESDMAERLHFHGLVSPLGLLDKSPPCLCWIAHARPGPRLREVPGSSDPQGLSQTLSGHRASGTRLGRRENSLRAKEQGRFSGCGFGGRAGRPGSLRRRPQPTAPGAS